MSKIFIAVLAATLSGGLLTDTAQAQNVKKEKQTDARIKKCQNLTGTERDSCLEQARKQPDPNGSTGDNQGARTDNTASPQEVQPGQPGAQSGAKKTEPTGNAGQGQRQQ